MLRFIGESIVISTELRKVQKARKTFYTTIPSNFAKELDINKGDYLVLQITEDKKIIISKHTDKAKITNAEIRKVQKAGESFSITIPAIYAKKLKLKKGDYITLKLTEDKTILIF